MKIFSKVSIVTAVACAVGLIGPVITFAATAPSLGDAATFGIISSIFTNSSNTAPETRITGNVCYTTGPDIQPISITGATSSPCAIGVQTAQSDALTVLNSQSCTSLGAIVSLNAITIAGGTPGHFPPGCYSSTGAMNIVANTTVTLDGPGVYIFRPDGAITTGANSKVILANSACSNDVFWAPTGAVSLGANSGVEAMAPTFMRKIFSAIDTLLGIFANAATSPTPTFVGNILDAAGITMGQFANLEGRVLAYGGTVTTDTNTITVPTCTTPATTTLRVIKIVDNTNGGTATPSNFMVHVKLGADDVSNSPLVGTTTPGTTYNLTTGTYTVSEDSYSPYVQSFSDVCTGGSVTLTANQDVTCTITNTYPASTPIPTPTPTPTSSSRSSGGSIIYGCKDPNALNYNYFSASNPALCIYTATSNSTTFSSSATTTIVTPRLPNTGINDDQGVTKAEAIASFYRSLGIGSGGDDVTLLQSALEQKGLLIIPQGITKGFFGTLTRDAILKYQASTSLPTVGIFGPLTRAKLISDLQE